MFERGASFRCSRYEVGGNQLGFLGPNSPDHLYFNTMVARVEIKVKLVPAGLQGNGAQEVYPYRLLEPPVRRNVDAAGLAAAIVGVDPNDARQINNIGAIDLFVHISSRYDCVGCSCASNTFGLTAGLWFLPCLKHAF